MALSVDERARREIIHRQRQRRDATLWVGVTRIGVYEYLTAGWAEQQGAMEGLAPFVDGVAVRMDARVAAYARGHNLTITSWSWGPFTRLVVQDEPLVLLQLQRWEQRIWYASSRRPA